MKKAKIQERIKTLKIQIKKLENANDFGSVLNNYQWNRKVSEKNLLVEKLKNLK